MPRRRLPPRAPAPPASRAARARRPGGVGALHLEQVAEFGQEKRGVALLGGAGRLPAVDEGVDGHEEKGGEWGRKGRRLSGRIHENNGWGGKFEGGGSGRGGA